MSDAPLSDDALAIIANELFALKQQGAGQQEALLRMLEVLKEDAGSGESQYLSMISAFAPAGYLGYPAKQLDRNYAQLLHAEFVAAFHAVPSLQFTNPAFVRLRQLDHLDLHGKRLAVLCVENDNYDDAQAAIPDAKFKTIRLQSLQGPLTLERKGKSKHVTASIESLSSLIGQVDYLWIPDPSLASLFFRCKSLPYRIAWNVSTGLIFPLWIQSDTTGAQSPTHPWTNRSIRALLHACGFMEICGSNQGSLTPHITRYHETRSQYDVTPAPEITARSISFYTVLKTQTSSGVEDGSSL